MLWAKALLSSDQLIDVGFLSSLLGRKFEITIGFSFTKIYLVCTLSCYFGRGN